MISTTVAETRTSQSKLKYIDILRGLVAFAVILSHSAAWVHSSIENIHSTNWVIAVFIQSLVASSPPIFVMISGALFLDPERTDSPLRFFRKRANRILIPLVFWSIIYFTLEAVTNGLTREEFINGILYGHPEEHLWYLYMLPGLYLFTPTLRTFVHLASPQDIRYLTISIFVVSGLYSLLEFWIPYQEPFIVIFIRYLGYYLCGYYLVRQNVSQFITFRSLLMLFVLARLTLFVGDIVLCYTYGRERGLLLHDNFSIPVIISSLVVFLAASKAEPFIDTERTRGIYRIFKRISPTTLGIYVIHPFIISVLNYTIGFSPISDYPYLNIPAHAIVVFMFSYAIVACMLKIPFLKRTV